MAVARRIVSGVMLFLSAGCALNTQHLPPESTLRIDRPPERTLGVTQEVALREKSMAGQFLRAYSESYANRSDATRAREMTRYGMVVIKSRCDLFFEQIGRGAQDTDFLRREFQSLSAALIAALGLARVGSDSITGVGLGSALGLQSIDNYSTVYFFSPDVSSVRKLVRRAFQTLEEEMLSPARSPRDYGDGYDALLTFQSICTAHEIKRLVTEAIDKGQTIAQFSGNEAQFSGMVDRALIAFARVLGLETLTVRDVVVLGLLIATKPVALDEVSANYVCSTLPSALIDQKKLCTKTSVTVGGLTVPSFAYDPNALAAAERTGLDAQWSTLRALLGARYDTEVATQKQVIASAAPQLRAADAAKEQARQNGAVAAQAQAEAGRLAQIAASTQASTTDQSTSTVVGVSVQGNDPK